ncbi:hypothetical protein OH76DRAFT_1390660 [Lentinus brumalis]|uniref:F-box domain-containing protein n=1 Tax=Lentinus brumalis TaxID=2498619 RepID=A0A371CST0_9APHY|nr:hypothetical protein OH76DRAFT_1390660 [Polyporus brumalis]
MTPTAGDGSRSEGNRLVPNLPPELWGMVVHDLSNADMRSFFCVSRLFHDLILPVLFSQVTVRYGLWRPDDEDAQGYQPLEMPVTMEEMHELEHNQLNICEVLLRIIRTPSFARLVKKLSIRAYSMVKGPGKDMVELFLLKEAISAMTNITSFRWEGRRPLPAAFILDALAQSSGHGLRDLSLPCSDMTLSCLTMFKRVQTLRIHPLHDAQLYSHDLSVAAGLKANEGTLAHLTLFGDTIWTCPVRSLLRLQELELIFLQALDGFDSILTQCADLRYLTLGLAEDTVKNFMQLLQSHPTAFPRLTAFKLLHAEVNDLDTYPLHVFLQTKKELRMFDLGWEGDDIEEAGVPLPLRELLCELPALEVVGLTVTGEWMDPEDIYVFAQHLPSHISALILRLFVIFSMPSPEFYDMLAKLTSLRFLYIVDHQEEPGEVKQQILANPPSSLQLFGYGSELRWLERDPQNGMPKDSAPWPISKVRFCTAEDFGCADWEWLLRHHVSHVIRCRPFI